MSSFKVPSSPYHQLERPKTHERISAIRQGYCPNHIDVRVKIFDSKGEIVETVQCFKCLNEGGVFEHRNDESLLTKYQNESLRSFQRAESPSHLGHKAPKPADVSFPRPNEIGKVLVEHSEREKISSSSDISISLHGHSSEVFKTIEIKLLTQKDCLCSSSNDKTIRTWFMQYQFYALII